MVLFGYHAKITDAFTETVPIIFKEENSMEDIKQKLNEAIVSQLEMIDDMDGEERKNAIADLAKLYQLKLDEDKLSLEWEHLIRDNTNETMREKSKLDEQVKDRYFRTGIAAAELIIPLIFYAFWVRAGFKFEQTGTITSGVFKGVVNRLKPTK